MQQTCTSSTRHASNGHVIEEQEEGEADYENGVSLTRILSLVGICVQIFNVLVSSRLVERILSSLLFSEDGF